MTRLAIAPHLLRESIPQLLSKKDSIASKKVVVFWMKVRMHSRISEIQKALVLGTSASLLFYSSAPLLALPPPEDTPEEVLRTEIITEARSPMDGRPLTAAEYAELRTQLEGRQPTRPQVSEKVRELIFLLRVRRVIRRIVPFIDF